MWSTIKNCSIGRNQYRWLNFGWFCVYFGRRYVFCCWGKKSRQMNYLRIYYYSCLILTYNFWNKIIASWSPRRQNKILYVINILICSTFWWYLHRYRLERETFAFSSFLLTKDSRMKDDIVDATAQVRSADQEWKYMICLRGYFRCIIHMIWRTSRSQHVLRRIL